MTSRTIVCILGTAVVVAANGMGVGRSAAKLEARNVAVPFMGCTDATIKGTYGFQRNGTTTQGPVTAVGIIEFDGQGNSVAQQTISRAGTISGFPIDSAPVQQPTYIINPDCTGAQIDPSGNTVASLVVVHGGAEILGMSLLAGNNVAVHFERITDPPGSAPAGAGRP
jgi:hypothetical protein